MADRLRMIHQTDTAVVIAAYNAEATIRRAALSALAQPEVVEVCVVDDCSADGTVRVIEEIATRDPRVRVIAFSSNQGPSAARNAAIDASAAPWIAILDADDYLLPGRLSGLHRHSADADFVADTLIRVQGAEAPSQDLPAFAPRRLSFEDFLLGNLGALKGPLDLGYLKPIMRREFLDRRRLRYRADMRLGEDYLLYAEALALDARFLVGGAAGYVSVERAGSLSKHHHEDDLQRLRDCDDHLRTLRAYTPSELSALEKHWKSVDRRLQWRRLITAVKTRDVPGALSTFRSPDASLYLAARLGEQVWLRSIGRWLSLG